MTGGCYDEDGKPISNSLCSERMERSSDALKNQATQIAIGHTVLVDRVGVLEKKYGELLSKVNIHTVLFALLGSGLMLAWAFGLFLLTKFWGKF